MTNTQDSIPLHSSSYEDDLKILDYCNNNKYDDKCKCVIIPKNILLFSKSSISPVYCWYSPCLKGDTYLTSLIVEEKKYCNITLCEIYLEDIYINNGEIRVDNDCAQLINPSIAYSQVIGKTRNSDIVNMFLPNFSIIIIISFFLLILLYYDSGLEYRVK